MTRTRKEAPAPPEPVAAPAKQAHRALLASADLLVPQARVVLPGRVAPQVQRERVVLPALRARLAKQVLQVLRVPEEMQVLQVLRVPEETQALQARPDPRVLVAPRAPQALQAQAAQAAPHPRRSSARISPQVPAR